MELKVRDIGGCKDASITIKKGEVTILFGLNESGKTSILRAASVLLSGNVNPLGETATGLKNYGKRGTDSPEASINGKGWSRNWNPGKACVFDTRDTDAPAIMQNPILFSISDLGLKGVAAADLWQKLLDTKVPRSTLEARLMSSLGDIPKRADVVKKLLEIVFDPNRGWRKAESECELEAKTSKRRWNDIAAEDGTSGKWGSARGTEWRPRHWDDQCIGLTVAEAEHLSRALGGRVEEALRKVYVSKTEIARRDELEQIIPTLSRKIEQLELTAEEIREEHAVMLRAWTEDRETREKVQRYNDKLRDRRAAITAKESVINGLEYEIGSEDESDDEASTCSCPSCGTKLAITISFGRVDKVEEAGGKTPLQDNLRQAKRELTTLKTLTEGVGPKTMPAGKPLDQPQMDKTVEVKLSAAIAERKIFRAEHAKIPTREQAADSLIDCSELEQEYSDAERRLRVVTLYAEAAVEHKLICAWLAAKGVLSPSGVRGEANRKALTEFNGALAGFSGFANNNGGGWSVVKVTDSWQIEVNSISVKHCSRSEQWRAAVAISLMLAVRAKSPVAIIDDMEVLQGVEEYGDTRMGLWTALLKIARKMNMAILGACASDYEGIKSMPTDLSSIRGYWIEKGKVVGTPLRYIHSGV